MLDVVTAARGSKCAGSYRRLDDATVAVSGEARWDAVAERHLADGSVGDVEVAGPAERDEGDAIQSGQQASATGPLHEVTIIITTINDRGVTRSFPRTLHKDEGTAEGTLDSDGHT